MHQLAPLGLAALLAPSGPLDHVAATGLSLSAGVAGRRVVSQPPPPALRRRGRQVVTLDDDDLLRDSGHGSVTILLDSIAPRVASAAPAVQQQPPMGQPRFRIAPKQSPPS